MTVALTLFSDKLSKAVSRLTWFRRAVSRVTGGSAEQIGTSFIQVIQVLDGGRNYLIRYTYYDT